MAKAKEKKAPTAGTVLTLPVQYGNVSIGELTASITASVDRKHLSLAQADRTLCGKRLAGKITAMPGNDNPEQDSMPGMESEEELSSVFDTRSFRATPKAISFGLSFKLESVDVTTLANFAKRAGKLIVTEVTAIPEDEKEAGGGE